MNLDLGLVAKIIVGFCLVSGLTALGLARWFKIQKELDERDSYSRENKL